MTLVALAAWGIAFIAAGGAVVGAIVGGLISFAGIVYSAKRDRDAGRRRELFDALQAYAFATDTWAAHLETLPPPDRQSRVDRWFFDRLTRLLIGGERSQYLFGHILTEWLFPRMKEDVNRIGDRYYEAAGRLALIAPPEVVDVLKRVTNCFLAWQDKPGPEGLEAYGPLRRELTNVGRGVLGSEAIERTATD